jgi:hypothetical protein
MIRKIILILILIIFFQLCLAKDWIDENIELTINGKFNQALSLLQQRIENDTTDFKSYFYLAATLNSKMTHFENLEFEDEFYTAIEKTIGLVDENQIDNIELPDSTKAQYIFYLGSAYGYRGFFEGRKGNWYSALSDGLKAINLLEESVELDSTLTQAYLGIGTYDYWSSSKLKFALWLPFIPDNRERGIELIKKSLIANGPARYMAMHQLVYILIDFEMFEDAQIYADLIVKEYPQSQFMWWAYSHVFYKKRDYNRAIASYKHLLYLIKSDQESNPAHIIKCNLKLAQLYFESEKYSECIFYCNSILNSENINSLSKKLENEISEAQDYIDNANEKIANK